MTQNIYINKREKKTGRGKIMKRYFKERGLPLLVIIGIFLLAIFSPVFLGYFLDTLG